MVDICKKQGWIIQHRSINIEEVQKASFNRSMNIVILPTNKYQVRTKRN